MHKDNADIVGHACVAFQRLACNNETKEKLESHGIFEFFLELLRIHKDNSKIVVERIDPAMIDTSD